MKANSSPPISIPRLALAIAFSSLGAITATVCAAPTVLAPQYAGSFGTGSGADAEFRQISNDWHESSVLCDNTNPEIPCVMGSGNPIGSYAWGTGLWGRADWTTIQAMTGAPSLINQWNGVAPTINFANEFYNSEYSGLWGIASLIPFFGSDFPVNGGENWTASFAGYIRITDPGTYNFSVLNDDGFFFNLVGAGGSTLGIGRDYLNPRERIGFTNDLALSEGLYGFELGMWNRLEAGVVDLRWMREGGDAWELVPIEHLLPRNAVPAPGTWALIVLGLVGTMLTRRSSGRDRSAQQ